MCTPLLKRFLGEGTSSELLWELAWLHVALRLKQALVKAVMAGMVHMLAVCLWGGGLVFASLRG